MTQLLQNALFGTALILAAVLLRRAMGERLLPAARLALWAVCLVRLLAPVFPASGLSLWGLAGTAAGAAPDWNPAPLPGGELGNVPAVNAPAGTAVPAPQPVEPAALARAIPVLITFSTSSLVATTSVPVLSNPALPFSSASIFR